MLEEWTAQLITALMSKTISFGYLFYRKKKDFPVFWLSNLKFCPLVYAISNSLMDVFPYDTEQTCIDKNIVHVTSLLFSSFYIPLPK